MYAAFDSAQEAKNFLLYAKSKFFRILVSSIKITQSAPSRVYRFVPLQNFTERSDIDWTQKNKSVDEQLFEKYGLSIEDRDYVKEMIRSLE